MTHEKTISDLAYHLWHARGCPEGSADVDWAEAERQVRGRVAGAADRALEAPIPAASPAHAATAIAQPSAAPRSASTLTAAVAADPLADTQAPRAKKTAKR